VLHEVSEPWVTGSVVAEAQFPVGVDLAADGLHATAKEDEVRLVHRDHDTEQRAMCKFSDATPKVFFVRNMGLDVPLVPADVARSVLPVERRRPMRRARSFGSGFEGVDECEEASLLDGRGRTLVSLAASTHGDLP
jgi:hypothetical protein